ncbi:MAG: trehalose-phosphatase [Acidobacteriota bacterium]
MLRSSGRGVLALDYDGTLAPFRVDPMQALPYPGVREAVTKILATGTTRVVLVSGRRAEEVRDLLRVEPAPEIWGVHGRQKLNPDGHSTIEPLKELEEEALEAAGAWVEHSGYGLRTEFKPGCLAVHWRGLPEEQIERASRAAHAALAPVAARAGMSLVAFDGGMELRPPQPNKGSVIRALIEEQSVPAAVAFLGDDRTDEDGFKAMQGTGALSVLVRPQWRETAAAVWLRPPEELLEFLARWAEASGGAH